MKKASCLEADSDLSRPSKGHDATYECTKCHQTKITYSEKHTGKSKCSVCGWKNVKPAALAGVSVNVQSKKTVTKTFTSRGYFNTLGRWVPSQQTHGTYKNVKVTIRFNKPKNGYKITPYSKYGVKGKTITKKIAI